MRLIDYIIAGLILIALGILIYIGYAVKSEGYACQTNPLVYASEKLSEANNAEFFGTGQFDKPGGAIVNFDRHNITIFFPNQPQRTYSTLNFTMLENALSN